MKGLLTGILILGSFSTYASNCFVSLSDDHSGFVLDQFRDSKSERSVSSSSECLRYAESEARVKHLTAKEDLDYGKSLISTTAKYKYAKDMMEVSGKIIIKN